MKKLILGQKEVYTVIPKIRSFKKVSDAANNINLRLTNMAGGFPLELDGHKWKDSERLYLCSEFSNDTKEHLDMQQMLLGATSGYATKCFGKSHLLKLVRPDFNIFRLQRMLFVVWQKCKELELLINLETNRVNSIGQRIGHNKIGKIVMICCDRLAQDKDQEIAHNLLNSTEIIYIR